MSNSQQPDATTEGTEAAAQSSESNPASELSYWPSKSIDLDRSSDALGRLSFETVWCLELAAIEKRRKLLAGGDQNGTNTDPSQVSNADAVEPAPHCAPELVRLKPTMGLALSGGGIRSASFNLGIIQAFAQQKLIGNLDYLSTVSGGGYIGGWLSAWIRRDGHVTNVEKLLTPDRGINAQASRQFVDPRRLDIDEPVVSQIRPGSISEKEPEPIVHLRANSNYLALRPGVFTPDSWALFAIYLRNIFLNLLVVIPTLLAVVLLVMTLTTWYRPEARFLPLLLPPLSIALILFIVMGISKGLSNVRYELEHTRQNPRGRQWFDNYFGWIVVATVSVAYVLTLDLVDKVSYFEYLTTRINFFNTSNADLDKALACGVTLGILQTILLNHASIGKILRGKAEGSYILWPLSGLLAGTVLGVLVYAIGILLKSSYMHSLKGLGIEPYQLQALAGVPLLLTSFFVAQAIQVGVLGRLEYAEVREKWSAFQARCFMGGLIWFGLVLHVYFISRLIQYGQAQSTNATAVAAVTWVLTTLGSLLTAQGSSSGGQAVSGNKWQWKDLLIAAGPPLFFAGLLAITSLVVLECQHYEFLPAMPYWLAAILLLLAAVVLGSIVDINIFSLQEMYAARLVRCFLGASRRNNRVPRGAPFRTSASLRRPDPITSMAPKDDFRLTELQSHDSNAARNYTGPLHLVNTTVNLTRDIDLQRQERKADSFVLSPIACGNPLLSYRLTAGNNETQRGYADGLTLGTAVSLSGAALSPNMGYYSSPAVTALLTLFNVRLGSWLGNPATESWAKSGPRMGWYHLLKEAMGLTDSTSDYVYISDGGHFDNLGVYELLRRRVRYIIASDAGADPLGSCNELGMIIRKAFVDFGIQIDINVSDLAIDPVTRMSKANYAIGSIKYPRRTLPDGKVLEEDHEGVLIYVKMTRVGNEPTDIETYRISHPDFPHQSTVYQFYSESQFESYRHLGYHIGAGLLIGNQRTYPDNHPRKIPAKTRTWSQVERFFEYLKAIGTFVTPKNWDEVSKIYDDKFALLVSRLLTSPELDGLRKEVDKITEILDVCEHLYHCADDQDAKPLLRTKAQLERDLKTLGAARTGQAAAHENAWMIDAITLLCAVMTSLRWETYESILRAGWIRVFRQWMFTSTFRSLWKTHKNAYGPNERQFVEDLLKDTEWVNLNPPPP